jgi:hypothetical protein
MLLVVRCHTWPTYLTSQLPDSDDEEMWAAVGEQPGGRPPGTDWLPHDSEDSNAESFYANSYPDEVRMSCVKGGRGAVGQYFNVQWECLGIVQVYIRCVGADELVSVLAGCAAGVLHLQDSGTMDEDEVNVDGYWGHGRGGGSGVAAAGDDPPPYDVHEYDSSEGEEDAALRRLTGNARVEAEVARSRRLAQAMLRNALQASGRGAGRTVQ